MSDNQKTVKTVLYTNIPENHEWFEEMETLFLGLEYPIDLRFDPDIEKLANTSNVYFKSDIPQKKQVAAACNSLFRSLLNLSVALGEYDNDK